METPLLEGIYKVAGTKLKKVEKRLGFYLSDSDAREHAEGLIGQGLSSKDIMRALIRKYPNIETRLAEVQAQRRAQLAATYEAETARKKADQPTRVARAVGTGLIGMLAARPRKTTRTSYRGPDGITKEAYGPAVINTIGPNEGMGASYMNPSAVKRMLKSLPGVDGLKIFNKEIPQWRTEGLIQMPKPMGEGSKTKMGKMLARLDKKSLNRKELLQHELTHYLRTKRGKLPDLNKLSPRKGLLTLAREEFVAHNRGLKRIPGSKVGKFFKTIFGTYGSTKYNYPRILKTLLINR